jgi:hypothetical protein
MRKYVRPSAIVIEFQPKGSGVLAREEEDVRAAAAWCNGTADEG